MVLASMGDARKGIDGLARDGIQFLVRCGVSCCGLFAALIDGLGSQNGLNVVLFASQHFACQGNFIGCAIVVLPRLFADGIGVLVGKIRGRSGRRYVLCLGGFDSILGGRTRRFRRGGRWSVALLDGGRWLLAKVGSLGCHGVDAAAYYSLSAEIEVQKD